MGSLNYMLNRFKASLRLIAMALVLFASTLALVGAGSACSKDVKTFVDLMGTVPKDSSQFTYWAAGDLGADEDLWDIYGKFKDSTEAKQLKEFVPVLAIVKQSAKAISYDNATLKSPVSVFRGDFDIKYIEGQLEAIGYSQTLHKEVGIWTLQDNQTDSKSVALQQGTVLMGDPSDLTACIDVVVKGEAQSLYEDPNILLVANRLPNGVIVEINRADSSHGQQYTDLVAYGESYSKAKKGMLKLTAVYMFGDSPSAGAAQQQIEKDLTTIFKEVKLKRDSNFVVATSQISITEFAQSLVEF
jgi:hypothetical protein